jgi:hypothetical protein
MTELRQYQGYECGQDGYPFAWHGVCGCDKIELDTDDCIFSEACLASEPAIKDVIREEAQNRCERCWHPYVKGQGEWSLCDESCRHGGEVRFYYPPGGLPPNEGPEGLVEARYRILTVHHLDEDKGNCRWWNLVALCQRCHLLMQRKVVMDRPWHYEHSEWFKPYAAAFYAFKYLGEDLPREDVMARMPELLALEYQGTQEALL